MKPQSEICIAVADFVPWLLQPTLHTDLLDCEVGSLTTLRPWQLNFMFLLYLNMKALLLICTVNHLCAILELCSTIKMSQFHYY